MRLFSIVAALILFSVVGMAQESTYTYNIKQNDIEQHAADLSLKINPLFTDFSNDNTVLGFSPEINFRLNTILSFQGQYQGSYYNLKPDVVKSENPAVYNGIANSFKPYQYYNGGLTLYIVNLLTEGKSRVTLPRETRNGDNHSYFLELNNIEKLHQVGIRLSAGQFQGQLAEKGLEFDGTNSDTLIAGIDNPAGSNFTSITYNLFTGGLSYEKVNHVKIKIKEDSLGTRAKYSQWKVYGDFLYARNMILGDILYSWNENGTLRQEVYDLSKYTEIAEFGYRVGFEFNHTGKYGYCYGVEAGARPGTGSFMARSYAQVKVGFTLNYRLVQY